MSDDSQQTPASFLLRDGHHTVVVDTSDRWWQPKDHQTKRWQYDWPGGSIGPHYFPAGWYTTNLEHLSYHPGDH